MSKTLLEPALVDLPAVLAARRRLARLLPVTPLVPLPGLSRQLGCTLSAKVESLLPTRAFKVRGAANLLGNMTAQARALGLVAATRGNHGQGLAWAGARFGARCTLFVPRGNSEAKSSAMVALGADVRVAGADFDDACAAAAAFAATCGARLVHPGEEAALVAGAGTMALELLEQCEQTPDVVIGPVGVGGCMAGVGLVLKALAPHVSVVGVQAEAAPAVAQAWRGREACDMPCAPGFADGLAVRRPPGFTLELLRRHVGEMRLVPESALASAMSAYLEQERLLAEGAGAAALAAVMCEPARFAGRNVVLLLTGANVDMPRLTAALHGGPSHPTPLIAT
ncbi:MAG: pyridoxal-phosphate dependent enzyme [Planctomycetes bacterium]|nr:pyridoxal-phosphate dependent enzyme [Planctomycetota bacterium]